MPLIPSRALETSETVTFLVGTEAQPFSVHKELLCHHAGYFRSAYSSGLREAQEDLFAIDDIGPTTFRIFVHWMYTGRIILDNEDPGKAPAEVEAGSSRSDDMDYEGSQSSSEVGREEQDATQVDQYGIDEDDGDDEDAQSWTSELRAVYNTFRTRHASDLTLEHLEYLVEQTMTRPSWVQLPDWLGDLRTMLHERKQAAADEEEANTSAATQREKTYIYAFLLELYIFADRFDVAELRIDTIDLLQRIRTNDAKDSLASGLPSFDTVSAAFDLLPETSPLRRWLIDVFAYDWDPSKDDEEQVALRKDLPREFLLEVAVINSQRSARRLPGERAPFKVDMCSYHGHQTWEELERCRSKRGGEKKAKLDEEFDDGEVCAA